MEVWASEEGPVCVPPVLAGAREVVVEGAAGDEEVVEQARTPACCLLHKRGVAKCQRIEARDTYAFSLKRERSASA